MKGSVNISDLVDKLKNNKIEKKYIRQYLKIVSTTKGYKQKELLEDLIVRSQIDNIDIVDVIQKFKTDLEKNKYIKKDV